VAHPLTWLSPTTMALLCFSFNILCLQSVLCFPVCFDFAILDSCVPTGVYTPSSHRRLWCQVEHMP
jgi:hypothetical protein